MRNTGFKFFLLGFQRLFGLRFLLVQLRLRLVELLFGLRQLGACRDCCFTHCFTHGVGEIGGRGARLHVDDAVELLVELLSIGVDARLCFGELPVGFRTRIDDPFLTRVEQLLSADLLPVGFHGAVDAVDHFPDGVLVRFAERVVGRGVFDKKGSGRVEGTGHAIGGSKERVVGGGGGAERGHGGVAVRIAQVPRIKHHAHNGETGRKARRRVGFGGSARFVRDRDGLSATLSVRFWGNGHLNTVFCLMNVRFWGNGHTSIRLGTTFVRFWGIGHSSDSFAGLFVRFCRIGHLGIRGGGLGGFGGYGEVAADFLAGVEHEFSGHRDFAGFPRQASFLHVRLVDAIRSDFLHGRRFAAVQIERHVLRPFRLHFRDAVDGTQRGDIAIRQSCGGQHLDVVQTLGVEEPIGAAERIAAACVNAGKHGHAKQGDHGD